MLDAPGRSVPVLRADLPSVVAGGSHRKRDTHPLGLSENPTSKRPYVVASKQMCSFSTHDVVFSRFIQLALAAQASPAFCCFIFVTQASGASRSAILKHKLSNERSGLRGHGSMKRDERLEVWMRFSEVSCFEHRCSPCLAPENHKHDYTTLGSVPKCCLLERSHRKAGHSQPSLEIPSTVWHS